MVSIIGLVQTIDSGLVGLALVYSLSVTGLLNGAVQSFAQTEMDMVSVERIMQYINNIQCEQSIDQSMGCVQWPNKGIIRFNAVFNALSLGFAFGVRKGFFHYKAF